MKIIAQIIGVFLLIVTFVSIAEASNPFDIEYPVAELGSCTSQQECKVYCDDPVNIDACISFAENIGMIKKGKAERMRNTEKAGRDLESFEGGPGGCKTTGECDTYCQVEENVNECIEHSVKFGYATQDEADRIRVQTKKGGPGGCESEEECRTFCDEPENIDTCFAFAVDEGKITAEEADFMKKQIERHSDDRRRGFESRPRPGPDDDIDEEKVTAILEEGAGPGGCTTFDECDVYCSDFNNGDECMEFAIEHQLIAPEKIEKMKRISAIKNGPGGCEGPNQCDAFCSEPENRQECFEFTKRNQLMSPEELERMEREVEIADKLDKMDVGPGDCNGFDECNNYCSNPENIEECISFSGEHGLLRGRTVEEMMGKTQELRDSLKKTERFGRDRFDHRREGDRFMPPFSGSKPPLGDDFSPDDFDNIPPEMRNMSPEEFEKMKREGRTIEGMPPLGDDFSPDDFDNIPPEMRNMSPEEFEKMKREGRTIEGMPLFGDGFDHSTDYYPSTTGSQPPINSNYPPTSDFQPPLDPVNYPPAAGFQPPTDSNYPPTSDFQPPVDPVNYPYPTDFQPPLGSVDYQQPIDNFKTLPPPPEFNKDFIPVEEPTAFLNPIQFLSSVVNYVLLR